MTYMRDLPCHKSLRDFIVPEHRAGSFRHAPAVAAAIKSQWLAAMPPSAVRQAVADVLSRKQSANPEQLAEDLRGFICPGLGLEELT